MSGNPIFPYGSYNVNAHYAHVNAQHWAAIQASLTNLNNSNAALLATAASQENIPSIRINAILIPGDKSKEGQLIEAVAIPWFEVIQRMGQDPESIYQIHWRTWEQIIAGAYKQLGFTVELTPPSGDGGRDVIATLNGVGAIRIYDQVKAYAPDRKVELNDVRAMLGVLNLYPNVSKGIITTTSFFTSGIEGPEFQQFIPYRLELKPRDKLLPWLKEIAERPH